MHILVLDDNKIRTGQLNNTDILKKYRLETMSFHIFDCAQKAYKWLEEENDFDIILLDYRVPHDPERFASSDISQRFVRTVRRKHWKKSYSLLIILVTEDHHKPEVQNFAADYAWDPKIHFHILPYDPQKGDVWLADFKKAAQWHETLCRQCPLEPGKDMRHDLHQIERVNDELEDCWNNQTEKKRIIRRIQELKEYYAPALNVNLEPEGLSFEEWNKLSELCISEIRDNIRRTNFSSSKTV